jgi:putative transposase
MKIIPGSYFIFLKEQSWIFLEQHFRRGRLGRPPKWTIRQIIEAILYICKTGCQWRMLPGCFPPWKTVNDYFCRWRDNGSWDLINKTLLELLRYRFGRNREPSLIIIDAQPIKTTSLAESKGFDGFKKVKGRKRTIIVDVLGFIVAVSVTEANHHDSKAAPRALAMVRKPFRLRVCCTDQAYQGTLKNWSFRTLGIALKTTPKSKDQNNIVTKHRWIVERTFSWILNYRRLAVDYERKAITVEIWIKIAMAAIGLRRLERAS